MPRGKMREVAAMRNAIHAQESREAAQAKSKDVIQKLKAMKIKATADLVETTILPKYIFDASPFDFV